MKFKVENLKLKIEKGQIVFISLFVILGIVALQIPVNVLTGAKVKFTLFDLFAPISGAFLGSFVGAGAVLLMQFANLIMNGFADVQTDTFLKLVATLRFLPLVLGVLYFSFRGKGSRLIFLVPMLSILAFVMHPVGRTVWFYSFYWLIPLVFWPIRERFLLARAFGSTFTAHAVGGAVWIWAFNLPAQVWISLIPTVALERSIFALGICASYILITNVLAFISKRKIFATIYSEDKKYLIKFPK